MLQAVVTSEEHRPDHAPIPGQSTAVRQRDTNATVMASAAPRARPFLVWGVWATLLAADLGYVAAFSDEVPFWDDWEFFPQLTGGRPVTLSWLWSAHNEHRIALPRVVGR